MRKIKILSSYEIDGLEKETNDFIKNVNLIDIKATFSDDTLVIVIIYDEENEVIGNEKYSEALNDFNMLLEAGNASLDLLPYEKLKVVEKLITETVEKAEKYDELNNTIPMWVDKVEEEAPRNPVDRVKRLIQENDELKKKVNELKTALNFALTDRADYFHQLSEALGKISTLVDGIKALEKLGFGVDDDMPVIGDIQLYFEDGKEFKPIIDITSENENYKPIMKLYEIVEGKK